MTPLMARAFGQKRGAIGRPERRRRAMTVKTGPVTGGAIKQAIESRNGRMLASFYAADAVVSVVDRNNPPSKPRQVRGRAAIDMFWDDICSRAMTHKIEQVITEGNRLAFTQACAYPDGAKVLCISTVELEAGLIMRQTVVQAWDE
jgi:hypothetical protein